jgi:hypothetical protein
MSSVMSVAGYSFRPVSATGWFMPQTWRRAQEAQGRGPTILRAAPATLHARHVRGAQFS